MACVRACVRRQSRTVADVLLVRVRYSRTVDHPSPPAYSYLLVRVRYSRTVDHPSPPAWSWDNGYSYWVLGNSPGHCPRPAGVLALLPTAPDEPRGRWSYEYEYVALPACLPRALHPCLLASLHGFLPELATVDRRENREKSRTRIVCTGAYHDRTIREPALGLRDHACVLYVAHSDLGYVLTFRCFWIRV